jgi:hypothetical protein
MAQDPDPVAVLLPEGFESTTIATLAALLTPAVVQQRALFVGMHKREPDAAELTLLQNAVVHEWIRLMRLLNDRFGVEPPSEQ